MLSDDKLNCRVCGYRSEVPPWGATDERRFSIFVRAVALNMVIKIRPNTVPEHIEIVGSQPGLNGRIPDLSLRTGLLVNNWLLCHLIFSRGPERGPFGFFAGEAGRIQ